VIFADATEGKAVVDLIVLGESALDTRLNCGVW